MYKRQILIRPEDLVDVVMDTLGIGDRTDGIRLQHIVNRFHFFRNGDGAYRHGRVSVSYTHLDVYKRQVYNRVNTIADMAAKIGEMVPDANVAFAHGQMSVSYTHLVSSEKALRFADRFITL